MSSIPATIIAQTSAEAVEAFRSMGVHGRVYIPTKTPKQKRDRIRYHGGDFIELIATALRNSGMPTDGLTTHQIFP